MSLHHGTEEGQWYTEKIGPRHWERLAVVYVRQSTMQQVLEHQESTRLQYGLVRRAIAWGCSARPASTARNVECVSSACSVPSPRYITGSTTPRPGFGSTVGADSADSGGTARSSIALRSGDASSAPRFGTS